jgi:pilus assembly protein CpaB
MGRRSALLVTGIVVAALGTLLVYLYANNIQRTVSADGELVTAYVATAPINVGTSGEQVPGGIEAKELPASIVPGDAVTDPAALAGQFTIVPIAAGQVVLTGMFGDPAQVGSLPIPEGQMGVAVQLDDSQRVAGFVFPGSEVAVFATVENPDGTSTTRLLLPRSTVAAVGPTTVVSRTTGEGEQANTEEISTAILTLALAQPDAEKLIFAQQQARLHFALLTPQSQTAPGGGVSDSNLFG